MPSIEESKRRVRAGLDSAKYDIDHDAVLASLQEEIDRHNESQQSPQATTSTTQRRSSDTSDAAHHPPSRFRFKVDPSDARKRKHSSRHRSRAHKHREDDSAKPRPAPAAAAAAHPFPREPVAPDQDGTHLDARAAFRESLFDALADDEGAAYWESVYSQPIHVYARPTVPAAGGGLEQMSDDDYAAYVQAKMWEKAHPHVGRERERREKRRRAEEEAAARRREEFVRRRQRAAWERAEREGARKFAGGEGGGGSGGGGDEDDDFEYVFDAGAHRSAAASQRESRDTRREEYAEAWTQYLDAWDRLKRDLLAGHGSLPEGTEKASCPTSKPIPWPVLPSKVVVKKNIEDFMHYIPDDKDRKSKMQLLKAERVRWHPDKMQQRFRGQLDQDTMKLVTGIFQVIDGLVDVERRIEEKK